MDTGVAGGQTPGEKAAAPRYMYSRTGAREKRKDVPQIGCWLGGGGGGGYLRLAFVFVRSGQPVALPSLGSPLHLPRCLSFILPLTNHSRSFPESEIDCYA